VPSHRRRKTILTVVHTGRLKRSIGQLFRGADENLGQTSPTPQTVAVMQKEEQYKT
jgi:hypothetical protein